MLIPNCTHNEIKNKNTFNSCPSTLRNQLREFHRITLNNIPLSKKERNSFIKKQNNLRTGTVLTTTTHDASYFLENKIVLNLEWDLASLFFNNLRFLTMAGLTLFPCFFFVSLLSNCCLRVALAYGFNLILNPRLVRPFFLCL